MSNLENKGNQRCCIFDENNQKRIAKYGYEAALSVNPSSFEYCWYWLRSPCINNRFAAVVEHNGSVVLQATNVNNYSGGVRPALWLNLCGGNEDESEQNPSWWRK
jgi:hypothetical protein